MTAVTDQEHIEHMEHVEHTGSSSHSGAGDGLVRQDTGHARARVIDLGKRVEGDDAAGTRPAPEAGADDGSAGGGEEPENREDAGNGGNGEQGEEWEKTEQKEKVEKAEADGDGERDGPGSGGVAGGSEASGGSDAGDGGEAEEAGVASDAAGAGSRSGSRPGLRSGSGSPSGAGSSSPSGSGSGSASETAPVTSATSATSAPSGTDPSAPADSTGAWDDGLIARRVTDAAALTAGRATALEPAPGRGPGGAVPPVPLAYEGPLRSRLDALRELVGLSRARLDGQTLAEAGRVLDEAAARRKLSGRHTVVAIAGATGSGKSQLFNTLAGVAISETGVRRPTTASPIACSWSDGAAGLIDRLGIPGRLRRRPLHSPDGEKQLRGLVLIDLPDHDSAAVQHREQVERILKLVDAVIWVVDPEKYADAVLHERYLRPMAGHAEVMFIVLNQVDRLPGEAADMVLDDLRRLLDDDGVALGEHGEPGATVLALSALTGEGVGELREALGEFVTERGAAARRVSADVDAAAAELRPVYAAGRRVGLSEEAREEFAARLADAVGATAAGDAAERAWLRNANRACGTPWLRLWRWYQRRGTAPTGRHQVRVQTEEEATARQRVEQAVRTVADRASAGLPVPWAQAVREAAVRGARGLPEALDELAERAGEPSGRPPRPGWWPAAVLVQAAMTLVQIAGGLWLVGQIAGVMAPNLGVPVLLMVCGIIGGPLVEWGCRMAARGPARRHGQDAERRLREAAASCGRARVLDPVAAELLRYREVREQYGKVVRADAAAG
ncbi:50S ribosome-binding GTPase [Streptomyces misionensis]|uniref:50S ribosome-binding GTPase n=1 Tax=Streptomyces misionensis TaxID=67331 RepID=A0A1H4VXY2_9ACTN|nr:YfjP family GTPase [Streptomyces misionensis]SEC85927.1 50S ribosome-binding GTPase [Streptomyces misionensis]